MAQKFQSTAQNCAPDCPCGPETKAHLVSCGIPEHAADHVIAQANDLGIGHGQLLQLLMTNLPSILAAFAQMMSLFGKKPTPTPAEPAPTP